MDVLELSLLLQKALFLQCVGDLRDQSPPEAAEIGKRREYPYWRDAKRRDAEQLYGMTHAAPCKKVLRLRHFAGVNALCAADLLDHVAQRRVREGLVQLAAAHGSWQRYLANFTQQSGAKAQRRADHAFRKGQEVYPRRHHSTLQPLAADRFRGRGRDKRTTASGHRGIGVTERIRRLDD